MRDMRDSARQQDAVPSGNCGPAENELIGNCVIASEYVKHAPRKPGDGVGAIKPMGGQSWLVF